jgi:hypothetical protein
LIIVFKSAEISPNELPPGSIQLDGDSIRVECTATEMSSWMKTLPLEVRQRLMELVLVGLNTGSIKI